VQFFELYRHVEFGHNSVSFLTSFSFSYTAGTDYPRNMFRRDGPFAKLGKRVVARLEGKTLGACHKCGASFRRAQFPRARYCARCGTLYHTYDWQTNGRSPPRRQTVRLSEGMFLVEVSKSLVKAFRSSLNIVYTVDNQH